MNDRFYMETLLTWTKAYCDLLLHGTIESSSEHVNSAMSQSLFEVLSLQNAIYKHMEQKGWYKTKQVPITKIEQAATQIANA
ncbi:MAG: spore coat protein [Bacilli bacterium]